MQGAAAARKWTCAWGIGALLLLLAPSASAFEFFDGRLQVHGFYEMQLRSIVRNYDWQDDWDVTQWYHVLNVEVEADIAPDGWGPFDLVSGFVRAEVRFDCVWTRGCGMFPGLDAYGERAGKLPRRLNDGRRTGLQAGNVPTVDTRRWSDIPRNELGYPFGVFPNINDRDIENPNEAQVEFDAIVPGTPGQVRAQERVAAGDASERIRFPGPNNGQYRVSRFFDAPGFSGFFGILGQDGIFGVNPRSGRNDDPADQIFEDFLGSDCTFGFQRLRGSANGVATRVLPHSPDCSIDPIAINGDKPNPFRGPNPFFPQLTNFPDGGDVNTRLIDPNTGQFAVGSGALPLRPAPLAKNVLPVFETTPQGVYLPNAAVLRRRRNGDFDTKSDFDQQFSQERLQWNRGASQRDTQELKEAYLDMEFFDSRLWIRAGKQSIVWGKTELFRTTDQFNPQDLALASLPSLEESRIALWALRGVWSFYDLGPFEDVRAELGFNFQDFEPADLGRCGEPYTPLVVCNKTFGLHAHGLTGLAIAGELRPDKPWESLEGLEIGARLEWRWGRFSFALANFYGYNDTPYARRLFSYSRNVDPFTGRPRETERVEPCRTGREDACLTSNDLVIERHSVNQQLFAMICASSLGFTDLDVTSCAQSVFNSLNQVAPGPGVPAVSAALSSVVSGQPGAQLLGDTNATGGANPTGGMTIFEALAEALDGSNRQLDIDAIADVKAQVVARNPSLATNPQFGDDGLGCTGNRIGTQCISPLVPLINNSAGFPNGSPGDVENRLDGTCILPTDPGCVNTGDIFFDLRFNPVRGLGSGQPVGLEGFLTREQEALLGCGEFYGTRCDVNGIDLMNTEVSAITQSWPGFEGTFGDWDTRDFRKRQPGTVGFRGGAVCTRFAFGVSVQLPGCRGPRDPGYDERVDGSTRGEDTTGAQNGDYVRVHPFTGQRWRSETAIVSWNALMGLAAFSGDGDGNPEVDDFDPAEPFRVNGCSLAKPQFCSVVQSFYSIITVGRRDLKAGGNGDFGRRDFNWHAGGTVALDYRKRNVLGFSMDFAEDVSKSNWSVETTWINDLPLPDNEEEDGISDVDLFNFTVSVDRPTFINFLNQNRTFFFNSQWFFQYVSGYRHSFPSNGPWNVLGTFTATTGYFQDRLLPGVTFVYDVQSRSAAILPQVTYRLNENFFVTAGAAVFSGESQAVTAALNPVSDPTNRFGNRANRDFAENGLSVVRERDELFLRIKYTF